MAGQGQLLARMRDQGYFTRTFFNPEQRGLTGPSAVPVRSYCIQSGVRGYRELMASRWARARRISCMQIGPNNIPVTPLVNPRSGHSFHIIHMTSEWDTMHAVDLLVKDWDSYIVGFRRQRFCNGQWTQGTWYIYSDVKLSELPKEIQDNCQILDFSSSHGDSSQTTPGGMVVLQDVFDVLAKFEDCKRTCDKRKRLLDSKDNKRAQRALMKAIVIFAEAFRFRSIYLAVLQRIRDDQNSSEIDCSHWLLLHDWGHCSRHLQTLCKGGPLPALDAAAPAFFEDIQVRRPGSDELRVLDTLDKVIGSRGELLLVKSIRELILSNDELAELERRARRNPPVPEPGFEDILLPDEPEDPEAL